ncbi:hypothetical protein C8R47DRAFT_1243217 [Mycena vitilis]|nr:hypothetical protein C8R47DRAFT_1243217 [Mycena vitilis]
MTPVGTCVVNGQTSVYHQPAETVPINDGDVPYTATPAATSNYVTYASSAIFTDGAAVVRTFHSIRPTSLSTLRFPPSPPRSLLLIVLPALRSSSSPHLLRRLPATVPPRRSLPLIIPPHARTPSMQSQFSLPTLSSLCTAPSRCSSSMEISSLSSLQFMCIFVPRIS